MEAEKAMVVTNDLDRCRISEGSRSSILRDLLEARFARLQTMRQQFTDQVVTSDWRLRLVNKVMYSTWADLRSVCVEAEGPTVAAPKRN